MGKKCPPQAFVGNPAGKNFRRGNGFGELKTDREFPVAIPKNNPGMITLLSVVLYHMKPNLYHMKPNITDTAQQDLGVGGVAYTHPSR
jgi:hypothetical protein